MFFVIFCLVFTASLAQEKCGSEKEFLCNFGGCISKSYLCDGSRECLDGSDETDDLCKYRSCSEGLDFAFRDKDDIFAIPSLGTGQNFRCGYGACISIQFICDGIAHCVADSSDETKELCGEIECKSGQFQCSYGACINRNDACDNRIHCLDKSDESAEACRWRKRYCRSVSQFRCSYGACIRKKEKCDGVVQCLDGSDETEETCGPGHTLKDPSQPITSLIGPNASSVNFPSLETATPSTRPPIAIPPPTPPAATGSATGCKQTLDDNVRVEIIRCTDDSNFCQDDVVPVGTIMKIFCERRVSTALRCEEDKLWHSIRNENITPRVYPCQASDVVPTVEEPVDTSFFALNTVPADCGDVPPFSPIPWLVGLFRKGEFACSGTIIGPALILTAGHCIVRNQATKGQKVGADELKIQYKESSNGQNDFADVAWIELHPNYIGGHSPKSDIAFVYLKQRLPGSHGRTAVCIDNEESLLNIPAYTFNRTVGQSEYYWSTFEQTLDRACYNKATNCTRHLNIGEKQFCGINENSQLYLHRGASGGPYLVSRSTNGRRKWYIAGIVSSSIQTSQCGIPRTVFTSVNLFHRWIIDCGFHRNCNT